MTFSAAEPAQGFRPGLRTNAPYGAKNEWPTATEIRVFSRGAAAVLSPGREPWGPSALGTQAFLGTLRFPDTPNLIRYAHWKPRLDSLLGRPFPQPAELPMDPFSPLDLAFTDPNHPFHLHHMELALGEAATADLEDEVPVGAVIIAPDRGVIASAHNMREQLHDPTAHAEMIAITQAAESLKSWRLERCILYVTLEPCPMCAGAIVQARLPLVVYGCADPKAGACHTLYQILSDPRLNHRARVIGGVLADRCGAVLTDFFARRRAMGKK